MAFSKWAAAELSPEAAYREAVLLAGVAKKGLQARDQACVKAAKEFVCAVIVVHSMVERKSSLDAASKRVLFSFLFAFLFACRPS